jgi:hypothetical protein
MSMEEVLNLLTKLQNEMSTMRGENAELRRVVDTLSAGGHTKNESSGQVQSKNDERVERVSPEGALSDLSANEAEKKERANPPSEAVTGSSLLMGIPVYHGIGSGELTAAEETLYKKWHRRTEKSLTGSKVKAFNGTRWITWPQMILRDVILNELTDILFKHTTTQQVTEMPPLQRKKFVTGDILLCAFLESKLSDRAQTKIAACPTAYHKWQKLEESYAQQSVAAQNGLTEKWNNFKQTANQTVEQYIERIDFMSMEMAAAGIPPSAQAKLYTLLAGLAKSWDTEVKILKRTRATYPEACEILLEAGIEKGSSQSEGSEHAYAAGGYPGRGGYQRSGYRGGRGQRGPMTCMVCGAEGHGSWNCPSGLRLNRNEQGSLIFRCYNCLKEGHRAVECREEKKRVGTVKPSSGSDSSKPGTDSTQGPPSSMA